MAKRWKSALVHHITLIIDIHTQTNKHTRTSANGRKAAQEVEKGAQSGVNQRKVAQFLANMAQAHRHRHRHTAAPPWPWPSRSPSQGPKATDITLRIAVNKI